MGCLILFMGLALPRFTLFMMWLFGYDRMDLAIDSWFLGFMGFLLLPYTTLFWILAYAPVGGVSGLGWFFVAFGFLLDMGAHFGEGAEARRRRAASY
ncbi:MAG: hypothetical protein MUF83_00500 [Acidimicrobiales bacterium]|jgi:hypothetical protein|nr:hypothetical protein [Acidimicrobiales bacterium]